MEQNTINTQNINIEVYRDGQLDEELTNPSEPRISPVDVIKQGIGSIATNVKLEARMAVFDLTHGTNYRAIRHELVAEKRKRQFEASIGLIATKK